MVVSILDQLSLVLSRCELVLELEYGAEIRDQEVMMDGLRSRL